MLRFVLLGKGAQCARDVPNANIADAPLIVTMAQIFTLVKPWWRNVHLNAD